jgi:hypothetical protein
MLTSFANGHGTEHNLDGRLGLLVRHSDQPFTKLL